jgi:hypothetical protein
MKSIEAARELEAHVKLNNHNNMHEIKAFFELDTERYKIQRKHHKDLTKLNPDKAWRIAKNSGIENLLQGRNQYPEQGFHTLMI